MNDLNDPSKPELISRTWFIKNSSVGWPVGSFSINICMFESFILDESLIMTQFRKFASFWYRLRHVPSSSFEKRFFSSNSGAYHLFRLCSKCSIRSPEINHLFEVILYTRSTFYFDLDPDFRKCNSSFRCTYYWAHSPRVQKCTQMLTVVHS